MPTPASVIAKRVEQWFERNQRPLPWRSGYDPYLVWVSEIMLQQTRMEVVLRYIDEFVSRFPTIHHLAAASEEEVLAAWSGLGYYRRARMLRAGAMDVVARFRGEIPADPETLQSIPGIGRYTSGAIASIGFDEVAPIVDGNVARILARLTGNDGMTAAWIESQQLVQNAKSPRMFNQGLMELGALVCTPRNPECGRCPIRAHCYAYRNDCVDALPAPKTAKTTRALTIPLYAIVDRDGRVLMRREHGALMNAMLHLPHGNRDLLSATPPRVTHKQLLGSFRHTITTRRIEFQVFAARLRDSLRPASAEWIWISPADLPNVPHPSYVAKAMTLLPVQSPACAGG